MRATLAPSSSLQTSLALAPRLEAIFMVFPEVTYALSRIGRPELGGDPEPVSNIETDVGLLPLCTAVFSRLTWRLKQAGGLCVNVLRLKKGL